MHNKYKKYMSWNDKSSEVWKDAWKKENTASSIASIGSGVIGAINSFASNNTIDDISGIESSLDAINNRTFSTGSFDNLQSNFNLNTIPSNFTIEDIDSTTGGQKVGNVLSGITSGASSGAAIGGPWGALIGGVVGAGSGIAGWITGNQKAKEEAARLNRKAEEATNNMLNNYSLSAMNTHNTNFKNSLLNMAAYGGNLDKTGDFTNDLIFINNGGTHEENPLGGVPFGVDAEGTPNLVEEGEVIYDGYAFSNRLKPTEKELEEQGFSKKYKDWTYAKIVKALQKESEERPNDNISKNGLIDSLTKVVMMQELTRMKKEMKEQAKQKENIYEDGGPFKTNFLRYAPVIGDAYSLLNNLFTKPDNSEADRLDELASNLPKANFVPMGDYINFKPVDRNYYLNTYYNDSKGVSRNLANTGLNAGNLQNALLTQANNTQRNLAPIFTQMDMENNNRKLQAAQFNRATNQTNMQAAMQALGIDVNNAQTQLNTALQTTQMRNANKALQNEAISQALSNLTSNLGAIGQELTNSNMMQWLVDNNVFPTYNNGEPSEITPSYTSKIFPSELDFSHIIPQINSNSKKKINNGSGFSIEEDYDPLHLKYGLI